MGEISCNICPVVGMEEGIGGGGGGVPFVMGFLGVRWSPVGGSPS